MENKFIILLIIITIVLVIILFKYNNSNNNIEEDINKDIRFELYSKEKIENKTGTALYEECFIFKDKQTGVLYLYVRGERVGGLTVMLDKEGKPLTDEGEK